MKKQFSKTLPTCKVTFSFPIEASQGAKKMVVVGDFNQWDHSGISLNKSPKDGLFKKVIELETGKKYEFRYLADNGNWYNDHDADNYCSSCYEGYENSVVVLPKPADDLTKIEGIGPKISELLVNAGLSSFEALAEAKTSQLKGILNEAGPKFTMHNPASWTKQSKLASKGSWEKLKKLQDELVRGK